MTDTHVVKVPGLKPEGDARLSVVDGKIHVRPPDSGTWTGGPEHADAFATLLQEAAAMARQTARPGVVARG